MSTAKHEASGRATPKGALELARKQGAKMVDLKFVDTFGTWQHFSLPISELNEEAFSEGLGFDGSSIRGWKSIEASDMLAMPDPATAFIDPFCAVPTLSLTCTIAETGTKEAYNRDPRGMAQRAEHYLQSTGLADAAYFGPEAEFFIFDNVQFDAKSNGTFYSVDSEEGIWNSGREELTNLGYKIRHTAGSFPVAPADTQRDIRTELVLTMEGLGVKIERQHHEVATAGQAEIDYRFDTLVRSADAMMVYKHVVKNVARKHGKTATFMPKPLFGDNGSGMHVHMSLWKDAKNLFFDANGYALISDTARWYIGGLIKHAPAVLAFAAPTTNSYRRLVPGYEAPINLIYSQRNRSAICRIPVYSKSSKAKRVECRAPDPSSNPYLTFAALLLAGLDGVKNKIEPPKPMDVDLYELEPEERKHVKNTPGSLNESLAALEADNDFLLQGGVFTPDVIDTWIAYKRAKEIDPVALRPHPYEFFLYYDV